MMSHTIPLIANAAGTCRTLEDVERFSRTPLMGVTVGSATWEAYSGNSGNTFWVDPGGEFAGGVFALNSVGLRNGGSPYYASHLAAMRHEIHRHDKVFRFSISPRSLVDLADMVELIAPYADEIEINESCPNVIDHGTQKDMLGFDFHAAHALGEVIGRALMGVGRRIPVYAKLPPYSNPADIPRAREAHRWADGLVVCNTFPNGFAFNGARPAITANGGLAGVSGPAMKPIALGQVVQFKRADPHVIVIGVGGIRNGQDVEDYMRAGAAGVQINTHISAHSPRVIEEIIEHCECFS